MLRALADLLSLIVNPCMQICKILLEAKYYLRTAIKESTSYWHHSPDTPIYGTGQGSGISPGVCCVTFSDLFNLHSDISTGSKYLSPVNNATMTIHNIGYVDDTTTTVCNHSHNNPLNTQQLTQSIQSDLQTWSNLLCLSGGTLEFSKTELFILSWKFNTAGTPYLEDMSTYTINLQCPIKHSNHCITAKSPQSYYKLLGFHMSPAQSMTKQYQVLHDKAH